MLMRWHGYGCFSFSDGRNTVVFDPHDGRSLGIYPPNVSANLVICTHNSFDRNAFRSIRGEHKDLIRPLGKCVENGFEFEGIPTKSLYDDGENACYRFTMDGITVVICGCIGEMPSPEAIERMKGAQILIVPVGEYGTMSVEKINDLVEAIGQPVVIPSEYKTGGISISLSPLQVFLEGYDKDSFTYVGSEVDFVAEDLSDYEGGIWIFDC